MSLQSVQRNKSLYEQTYQVLRSSILLGELAPGERLIETQLAGKLQVSRTPIREAMRRLQQEFLITDDAGDGLRVTAISETDAVQLYDCRIALEQLSVAGACQMATPDQLQAIHHLVVEAEQGFGSRPSPLTSLQMLDLDSNFHRLIAESSGNRWLVTLLDQVFDKMTLLRVQTTQYNSAVLEIRDEHRRIYEAIAHRDAGAAVEAIHHHLVASKERVVQEVQNLQNRVLKCS